MSTSFPPRDIHAYLAAKVLGQAGVLRLISVSLYKHIHGLKAGNVLFIGNSGTGKTTVMRAISQFYEDHEELAAYRTMIIINANTLAPEVAGEDRTTRLFRRIEARVRALYGAELTAAQLKEAMENATVCVDEVDKISARMSSKPNVEGITTQYALLTLLEGEDILYRAEVVDGEGRTVETDIPIDTSKLLFICGGAFEELYDQVNTLLVNRRDDRRLKETSEVDRLPDGTVKVRTVVRFRLKDYRVPLQHHRHLRGAWPRRAQKDHAHRRRLPAAGLAGLFPAHGRDPAPYGQGPGPDRRVRHEKHPHRRARPARDLHRAYRRLRVRSRALPETLPDREGPCADHRPGGRGRLPGRPRMRPGPCADLGHGDPPPTTSRSTA
jgi:energy-coupling factor transporter ATP-binding protein EcfA2